MPQDAARRRDAPFLEHDRAVVHGRRRVEDAGQQLLRHRQVGWLDLAGRKLSGFFFLLEIHTS